MPLIDRRPVGGKLADGDAHHAFGHGTRVGHVREVDERDEREGPDEVAEPDAHPVHDRRAPADAAVDGRTREHGIARVELGTRDEHEVEAEREDGTAHELLHCEGKRGVAHEERAEEPAEPDVEAGEYGEGQLGAQIHAAFGYPEAEHLFGDFLRGECVGTQCAVVGHGKLRNV